MKIKHTALLLCAAVMLTGCSSNAVDQEIKLPIYGAEEITFEVATAEYMDITDTESMGVTIGYPYSSYLTYPAEALVMSTNMIKGREVAEGDILVELDSSDLDYEISNQQTIVDAAYAASLGGSQGAILQYQIEQYTLDMLLAEKEKYTIRAPFNGVITEVNRNGQGDGLYRRRKSKQIPFWTKREDQDRRYHVRRNGGRSA